ncbi:hypothetical protein ACFE04_007264 [Oxalis oulophora]
MRELRNSATTTTTTTNGLWNSPIPYLFGGLGALIVLISAALIILACSQRKRTSSSSENSQEKVQPPRLILSTLDPEPKFVVIMPGDDKPTYLANPVTNWVSQEVVAQMPICTCHHQQVAPH